MLAYPPCGAMKGTTRRENGKVTVLSLAQFRSEKDQMKQLEAWALLPPETLRKAKLVIAGAVRHADDQSILDALKRRAASLDGVEFLVSAPRHEIMALLQTASVGLHTMRLEHFGIAVVEFMAASLVVVAHASGGPLLDIVGTSGERGFLATDARDYAAKLSSIIEMDASSRRKIGENARAFVAERFSDSAFGRTFVSALAVLLNHQRPPAAATVLKGGLN